jgi:hypothetical protein
MSLLNTVKATVSDAVTDYQFQVLTSVMGAAMHTKVLRKFLLLSSHSHS